MKKIILLYFAVIFACLFVGGAVALSSCYSLWYLILLIFPISLGWLPISPMFKLIPDHLTKSTVFLPLMFLLFVAVLVIGARYLDDNSFWGIFCGAGAFTSALVTAVIMLRVQNLWIIRS